MTVETTLALVKPGAVSRGQSIAILSRATAAGLRIRQITETTLSRGEAEIFYAEHQGRGHYERIVANLSSGPVVAAVLEGPNAIAVWRGLLGASDPAAAAEGTIRHDFGTALPDNAAHGSDSLEAAAREIAIVYRG